ncbi:sugar transferase [Sphingobacteriaceae bacterium WQ 2009]|uniref:Sugar transferase n=1 Tax=Rhinopithecimicrobium faecis TaxID=2820698 RepID=A0A8T4H5S7_9SPHI|nr:sugar transferase [Sphingobacteriaceae bacterium WQ 2009]
MYRNYFKRIFDIIISLVGIIILSPIFIVVTIGLSFANSGKPFFFQSRPGLNGVIFKIIKFKTMNDKVDSSGELLPDSERLTSIGSFVRKTSLDEIPQLFNVLLGHMSIIGPRPLLVSYLDIYNSDQARRHEVRPGITGWAQVNGRNAITWKMKFILDVYYVDNISLLLDTKIFFMTIKKVFIREGISSKDHVTIEPFRGDEN